jgi:hypothetical protein
MDRWKNLGERDRRRIRGRLADVLAARRRYRRLMPRVDPADRATVGRQLSNHRQPQRSSRCRMPMSAKAPSSRRSPKSIVPALVVTVPVALIAVILPMWGIHGAMTLAKHSELERLTATLQKRARQRPVCVVVDLPAADCGRTGRAAVEAIRGPRAALCRDSGDCVGRGGAGAGSGVERVGFTLTLLQSDPASNTTFSITKDLR